MLYAVDKRGHVLFRGCTALYFFYPLLSGYMILKKGTKPNG